MIEGKTIVITGGFGALGRGVAAEALKRGARVAQIDAAPAPADVGAALGIGGVDLSNEAAARQAADAVKAKFGAIHGWLNIAGMFRFQTLSEGDLATWELLYRVNVLTAAAASKAALPHLLETKGAIVNVGAFGAERAGAGMGGYAASKAGVAKLTEALAAEVKDKGVRVNAVLPSTIDTAANRKDMPKADFSSWVSVTELANVMLFLASDEASAITGALIPVLGRV